MLRHVAGPGQMLACASPQEGQHHDLFNIQILFEELCEMLSKAGIEIKGLFLNADAGFDSQELRKLCKEKEIEANIATNPRNGAVETVYYQYFDEELYKYRTVVDHRIYSGIHLNTLMLGWTALKHY